jgi:hypothetical protein
MDHKKNASFSLEERQEIKSKLREWAFIFYKKDEEFQNAFTEIYAEEGCISLVLKIYTFQNEYSIIVNKTKLGRQNWDYDISCSVYSRMTRPGELSKRGKFLFSGLLDEESWQKIKDEISAYEIHNKIKPDWKQEQSGNRNVQKSIDLYNRRLISTKQLFKDIDIDYNSIIDGIIASNPEIKTIDNSKYTFNPDDVYKIWTDRET